MLEEERTLSRAQNGLFSNPWKSTIWGNTWADKADNFIFECGLWKWSLMGGKKMEHEPSTWSHISDAFPPFTTHPACSGWVPCLLLYCLLPSFTPCQGPGCRSKEHRCWVFIVLYGKLQVGAQGICEDLHSIRKNLTLLLLLLSRFSCVRLCATP